MKPITAWQLCPECGKKKGRQFNHTKCGKALQEKARKRKELATAKGG